MRHWQRILLGLAIIVMLSMLAFVVWGSTPAKPMPEALAALQSDELVSVTQKPWLVFSPVVKSPQTGLIFYPGGRVDYRAYAPQARAIAQQGYLVIIVPMPLNLAVFGINRADEIFTANPEIKHWAIAGHSLGGSMAANYAANHSEKVDGMALWASYPASSDDLSGSKLRVVSIYGTLDGLVDPQTLTDSFNRLPKDTLRVKIEGGDHAQFGWYGPQSGDHPATISRYEQQNQTVQATLTMLQDIETRMP